MRASAPELVFAPRTLYLTEIADDCSSHGSEGSRLTARVTRVARGVPVTYDLDRHMLLIAA